MKTVEATLESLAPLSMSRYHQTPRLDREIPKDYEARTWRERLHALPDGTVYMPPTFVKNALGIAAKYLGLQIPGKGKSTYTKHFDAGVIVPEGATLGIKKEDVPGEWLFLHSSPSKPNSPRVEKCYPRIDHWKATFKFLIVDEIITEDVFRRHLEAAGTFVGLGRFRPINRGFYGRFKVTNIKWA